MHDLSSILSSDKLLGCFFLIAIALVSLKLLPFKLIPERGNTPVGLSTAIAAYKSYGKASKSSLQRMRTTFHAGLRKARNTKRVADEIGYAEKLERLERAIEMNAFVSGGISKLAATNDDSGNPNYMGWFTEDMYVGAEDHARVREALKHFVRDWSEEGRTERSQSFGLVLDALGRLEGEVCRRNKKRVLVPGAGLGRLAWEISQLGSF